MRALIPCHLEEQLFGFRCTIMGEEAKDKSLSFLKMPPSLQSSSITKVSLHSYSLGVYSSVNCGARVSDILTLAGPRRFRVSIHSGHLNFGACAVHFIFAFNLLWPAEGPVIFEGVPGLTGLTDSETIHSRIARESFSSSSTCGPLDQATHAQMVWVWPGFPDSSPAYWPREFRELFEPWRCSDERESKERTPQVVLKHSNYY